MCGIVGYVGGQNAVEIILEGLTRLEYRGYDSAGIAVSVGSDAKIVRAVGKLENLKTQVTPLNLFSHMGIGHTRWATHGRPSEINAHPHRSGNIVLVHNGIVENYRELKTDLERKGFVFLSDTDTEVLAHLIKSLFVKDLLTAVREAAAKVRGSYSLAVMDVNNTDLLVVTRRDSPLVVGISPDTGEYIAASDIPAALHVTRDFIMLSEGEFACLSSAGVALYDTAGLPVQKKTTRITWDAKAAEKDGYPAFMLKEIHEQPRAIQDTLRGKVIPDEGKIFLGELDSLETDKISRLIIVACGTSLNAATVGKLYIEKYAKIPVEVDIASEFLQRGLTYENGELVMVVSQSGETADTKSALRAARKKGAKVAAICNVVGSAIAYESDYCVYTHAGPEISVASTKAFTAQTVTLLLFALWLAEKRKRMEKEDISAVLAELLHMPEKLKTCLKQAEHIKTVAEKYIYAKSMLFLARYYNYPIAYEGALKLKELSYIHAEGYAAGEMKHGPIALLDEDFPVIVLAPNGAVTEKVFSAVQEVAARGARVIAVITEGAEAPSNYADIIAIPSCSEELSVFLTVAVAQLFAYYAAAALGRDVDKPRNLAKSVTVE